MQHGAQIVVDEFLLEVRRVQASIPGRSEFGLVLRGHRPHRYAFVVVSRDPLRDIPCPGVLHLGSVDQSIGPRTTSHFAHIFRRASGEILHFNRNFHPGRRGPRRRNQFDGPL